MCSCREILTFHTLLPLLIQRHLFDIGSIDLVASFTFSCPATNPPSLVDTNTVLCFVVYRPSWVSSGLSRATTLRRTRLMPLRQDHHHYTSRLIKHPQGHRHHIYTTLYITPQHSEETYTLHHRALHQAGRRRLAKLLGLHLMLMKNLRHISTCFGFHVCLSDQMSSLDVMCVEAFSNKDNHELYIAAQVGNTDCETVFQ